MNDKKNEKVSTVGLLLDFLGVVTLLASIVSYKTGYTPILFIGGIVFIALGAVIHYLQKISIINYEILKHLKDQDKK